VKKVLAEEGNGKVLVVDGGGSLRCALLGGNVAELAKSNGWAGLIIYGCIRDSQEVIETAVGVKAINTCPRKSIKRHEGQVNVPVRFAGVTFTPGHHVYADQEGVVVVEKAV
jgi:regulator of ribonuclease activity A